jgi:putative ABC transport system permease protein
MKYCGSGVLVFAVSALTLAAIGLYGIMSNFVAERKKEIGIRMAVGAKPVVILRLMLARGMILVLVGCLLGLLGAVIAGQMLTNVLFGINAFDLFSFGIALFLLLVVSLIASLLPAWKASQVDPVHVLRE